MHNGFGARISDKGKILSGLSSKELDVTLKTKSVNCNFGYFC
jgi:hypothetical protein